jgi:preprotein translocase subunit SecD
MSAIRDNWRVIALVVLLALSSVALFAPPGTFGATAGADGPTNLQYGIELSGGSRIRAPVAGMTATTPDVPDQSTADRIESTVQSELGLDPTDVRVVPVGARGASNDTGTVEVFADPISRSQFDVSDAQFQAYVDDPGNVSRAEFRSALDAAGVGDANLRRGVTQATLDSIVNGISGKINAAGLSGGSVRVATSATGERFVVVESPGQSIDQLRELISRRGAVEVRAFYPAGANYTNTTIITQEMEYSVGPPSQEQGSPLWFITVTFQNDESTQQFVDRMQAANFDESVQCRPSGTTDLSAIAEQRGRCLITLFDEEVVSAVGVQGDFGRSLRGSADDFQNNPTFRISVGSQERARDLQVALQAGSLPASLDIDQGTEYSLEPALAQQFKVNSFITGLLAVLAVALVVYIRYGDARVAVPMVVTALSEVVLLLGFAAAIGYPLDLSVIAGFIAVIGTGVDDLIIIADEVMSEGGVNSSRVFQSRFRKAFWVIGAAAATTIIAMSPLAVLSLGDLQGFAIVTIAGVVAGVLITRPAYGDILRALTTSN